MDKCKRQVNSLCPNQGQKKKELVHQFHPCDRTSSQNAILALQQASRNNELQPVQLQWEDKSVQLMTMCKNKHISLKKFPRTNFVTNNSKRS